MDWTNVNLKSGYERSQNIIDPLSFDCLIMEVYCNCKEVNKETVMAQFEEDLKSRIHSAREVIKNNLENLVKQIKEEREE